MVGIHNNYPMHLLFWLRAAMVRIQPRHLPNAFLKVFFPKYESTNRSVLLIGTHRLWCETYWRVVWNFRLAEGSF